MLPLFAIAFLYTPPVARVVRANVLAQYGEDYVAAEKTYKTVAGSGGLSPAPNELEGIYAFNWAKTIWADLPFS